MDNEQLDVREEEVICGAEVIKKVGRSFLNCYRGRMARKRGHRGWNVDSEGKDNRKDGRHID